MALGDYSDRARRGLCDGEVFSAAYTISPLRNVTVWVYSRRVTCRFCFVLSGKRTAIDLCERTLGEHGCIYDVNE